MPNLLIRDVPKAVVDRLKARARTNGRSLQEELREVIEHSAPDLAQFKKQVDQMRKRLAGRPQADSVKLLREDRER